MSRTVTVVLQEREHGRAVVCAVFDTLKAAADAFPAALRRKGGYRLADSELYETDSLGPAEVMRLPDPGPVAGSGEVRLLADPQLYAGHSVSVSVYPLTPDPDEDLDEPTVEEKLLAVVESIAKDVASIRECNDAILTATRPIYNIDTATTPGVL